MKPCSHCDSDSFATGLGIGLSMETGTIGLEYKKEKKGFLMGNPFEPLRLDICKKCGTVQRWYVTNADRPWAELEESTNIG